MTGHDVDIVDVLVVPGLNGSGPDHWQSHLLRLNPGFRCVEQPDWHTPDIQRWSDTLARAIANTNRPVVVVAHSFGCLASVACTAREPQRIRAALLVAPADPDRFHGTAALSYVRLQYASTLVASRNDPCMAFPKALMLAERWGSGLVDLGPSGHINIASGFGRWPGLDALLASMVAAAGGKRAHLVTAPALAAASPAASAAH